MNGLAFDVRSALFALLGKDVTRVNGFGPYLSLKLVAECGDDLLRLAECEALHIVVGSGAVQQDLRRQSSVGTHERRGNRAASLLRFAAVTVGRTDTAFGAFYRRLSARIGKAKAVTATARKIAVLF